jgi:hypothetical protein
MKIKGRPTNVNKFDKCFMENGFNCAIEMPKDIMDANESTPEKERKKLMKKYGIDNWYDWAIKFWGTKWNVYDKSISRAKVSEFEVRYVFGTAWSPPINFAITASSKFKLKISLEYDEPGNGYRGNFVVKDGKIMENHYEDYVW